MRLIFFAAGFGLENRVRGLIDPDFGLFDARITTRGFFFQRRQLHRFAPHHAAMLHQAKARTAEQYDEGHGDGN